MSDHKKEVVAIIPVRRGSKRVKGKNIREFRGQALLEWSINAALQTPELDKIVVSTDDPDAARLASAYPVIILDRPAALSTDTASTFDVLKFVCLEQLPKIGISAELVVLLQATSPLREYDLISKCIQNMLGDSSADRLLELNKLALATGKIEANYWTGDFPEQTRSQDLPMLYFPSGRVYVYRTSSTLALDDPSGKKTSFIIGEYETNINIDNESDFDKLEFVYSKNSSKYEFLLNREGN